MRFLTTFQAIDFLDSLVSLTAAFILGTLIGAERQYRQRTAGLRTNVLVAVGAAAFVDLGCICPARRARCGSSPMWSRGSASSVPASS